jgi:hypothetical protein
VFFEYVGQSYGFFLSGDDYACSKLDDELTSTFAARDEEAVAGIEQLEAANALLQEEIEALKATPSPVLELQVSAWGLGTTHSAHRLDADAMFEARAGGGGEGAARGGGRVVCRTAEADGGCVCGVGSRRPRRI